MVKNEPTLKYSSKRYHQYMLRVRLYPMFGEMQLRLITRDTVQLFLAAKLRSGLSWRTVVKAAAQKLCIEAVVWLD